MDITIVLEDKDGQHHSATIDALDQESLETIAIRVAEKFNLEPFERFALVAPLLGPIDKRAKIRTICPIGMGDCVSKRTHGIVAQKLSAFSRCRFASTGFGQDAKT